MAASRAVVVVVSVELHFGPALERTRVRSVDQTADHMAGLGADGVDVRPVRPRPEADAMLRASDLALDDPHPPRALLAQGEAVDGGIPEPNVGGALQGLSGLSDRAVRVKRKGAVLAFVGFRGTIFVVMVSASTTGDGKASVGVAAPAGAA
jgi:hypothetical protein